AVLKIFRGTLMKLETKIKYAFIASAVLFFFASCASKPTAAPEAEPMVEAPAVEEPAEEEKPAETPVEEPKEDAALVEELLAQIEEARKNALANGADKALGNAFQTTDSDYEAMKASAKSEDLKDVLARYKALDMYAQALALKNKIDSEELSKYDSSLYDNSCSALKIAEESLSNKEAGKDSLTKATFAYDSFKSLSQKAYKIIANDSRKKAMEQKKNAESVRAEVAAADAYKAAVQLIKDSDAKFSFQNYEEAYKGYDKATSEFASMFESVSKRRQAALEAMEAAKQKQEASEQNALQADTEAPLGDEEVEGIVTEDTNLLEEDNYDNPENVVIELDDVETSETVEVTKTKETTESTESAQEVKE
nr:hypothetical protein [Treponema sp.]